MSILSVLAGRYQPCGSLAASTCPVSASATTNAEALMSGSPGTERDGWLTITPREANCGPPMACATGAAVGEGPPSTSADAGAATPSQAASTAHAATKTARGLIRSSMTLQLLAWGYRSVPK